MTDRIIEEVDQKLEKDQVESGIKSIYNQLSDVDRQVAKFMSKMKHNQKGFHQQQKYFSSGEINNHRDQKKQSQKKQILAKYNYYGKKYRFQAKQQQLNVPQPQISRLCHSEIPEKQDNYFEKELSQKKGQKKKLKLKQYKTNQPEASNIFFDDGQVKFPNHNYYIYFEPTKVSKNWQNKTYPRQNPQHFKPAWVMEKKINNLQKQVKVLKQKERKNREAFTMSNFHGTKPSMDGPINIKSNLQKMIDTLWI